MMLAKLGRVQKCPWVRVVEGTLLIPPSLPWREYKMAVGRDGGGNVVLTPPPLPRHRSNLWKT